MVRKLLQPGVLLILLVVFAGTAYIYFTAPTRAPLHPVGQISAEAMQGFEEAVKAP